MWNGSSGAAIALVAVIWATTTGAAADAAEQARFHVLGVDSIDSVKGMHVYTIRDDELGACYALFVMNAPDGEPPHVAVSPPAVILRPDQLERVRIASALRDNLAMRATRLAELGKRVSTMWTVEYESERERIETDYEGSVRTLLPELYPAAQVAPGWRTTGADELNGAVRRAIADGDAVEAAASRSALDDQLLHVLTRRNEPSMLAVSAPVACTAAAAK